MNDKEMVEQFKLQHVSNYKKSLIELGKNNTKVLFEDDIISILKKPPLDSMDMIKSKYLELAKKNNIILNSKKLDIIIDKYRELIIKDILLIKDVRINDITDIVENYTSKKENEIIKITKTQLNTINKKMKLLIKEVLKDCVNKILISSVNDFCEDEVIVFNKFSENLTKYLTTSYQKQVIDSIEFKLLVKDTTLINGFKENGERYVFTLSNSHILNTN